MTKQKLQLGWLNDKTQTLARQDILNEGLNDKT